jgi:hypothetical protein
MALRLIRVRPGDRLSCHHHFLRSVCFQRNLTPAPGRQAHTTSPYALASSVRTSLRATPSRPWRPPPTFATTANAPQAGKDGGSYGVDLGESRSGMFFGRGLDGWNRIDWIGEISFSAQSAADRIMARCLNSRSNPLSYCLDENYTDEYKK